MSTLDGKVAVITGGTNGIGARAAELFVNEQAESLSTALPPFGERGDDIPA
jgi:NAD(P)-dependent dehydrogenase (short-subunit alcohol dehydrogenase family)